MMGTTEGLNYCLVYIDCIRRHPVLLISCTRLRFKVLRVENIWDELVSWVVCVDVWMETRVSGFGSLMASDV
jgi:hypothetical protein